MESLVNLGEGFLTVLTPMNMLWVFIGAVLGTAVGVLPGLGSAMAVALLLPVTFSLDPIGAFIMFAGVLFGGLFGDSISGILMNTPGNSTAIAGSIEGHRMAKSGRASQALATSAIGAFIGGIVASILVVFFAPGLARLATLFGPAEYLALAIFAFVAISAVVSESVVRGLSALVIGLAISVVGIDGASGAARFTGGLPELFDGIDIVVITVGLLALGEVFNVAARRGTKEDTRLLPSRGRLWLSRREFRLALPAWFRGTAIGVPFGIIPVGGSEVPTFLSYGTERKLDSRRSKPMFGRGAIQGVAGPEAAGNATAGTAMGALLALGLPTSATAAILLAAFRQYGLQPGPLLFERASELVWALLASFFIGMVVLLILNLPFAPLWAKLLKVPRHYLYAGITVFAMLGVYATSSKILDLVLVLAIGLLGFAMRRYGLPVAPVLIAVILGPLAETEYRRAMAVSEGDPAALIASPISATLYGVLVLVVVGLLVQRFRRRRQEKASV
ncbi:putative tricarboxylic transport membrane protein [Actinoalloteichus hoggarensis]|uniref:Tripartite tricarboxylate transporter TctA family protein n=1 Tax=Actinoalloteichus hoggarensis TaxID=1470176 RepID=A0A221VYV4_9PSEU|nr:tripartite tricarboxylate transporter permease [Actinoalloteichus hoggarensis]ASO18706.1 Tripartite tricarboxylate transporter TctA family protein [Actinoalloteichus hoggarensis]MBB5919939.1 putative tricarboxylic transport membrane protein [Actinoalloteichus hoggarensis]